MITREHQEGVESGIEQQANPQRQANRPQTGEAKKVCELVSPLHKTAELRSGRNANLAGTGEGFREFFREERLHQDQ